jgi:hypothetical protein
VILVSTDDRHMIDEVWAQINAMAADTKSWQRRRVLEIYCGDCNELIAQVMESDHGHVIVYRTFKGATVLSAPITGKAYESQSMAKMALRMLADGGSFVCFCKCSRTVLEEPDLTGAIKKGQRRVVRRHTATGLDK